MHNGHAAVGDVYRITAKISDQSMNAVARPKPKGALSAAVGQASCSDNEHRQPCTMCTVYNGRVLRVTSLDLRVAILLFSQCFCFTCS